MPGADADGWCFRVQASFLPIMDGWNYMLRIYLPQESYFDGSWKASKGHEGNWVQTVPNKGFGVILRLHGPLEPWFDKKRKPGDFELVK